LVSDDEVALAKQMERGRQAQRELDKNGHGPEERAKLESVVEQGEAARRHFIRSNTRLVVSIAKKYRGQGLPFPDLVQAGNIGLIRAVDRFDHTMGNKLSTYATWWIRQSIMRFLQNQKRTIRLPAHTHTEVHKVYRTAREMEKELGRPAKPEEIGQELGLSTRRVRWLQRISRPTLSLETPVGEEGSSELGDFVKDKRAPSPIKSAEKELMRQDLEDALKELDSREAHVLRRRFGLEGHQRSTLRELGDKLGISRERVRQIQARALRKLRRPMTAHKLRSWLK
jgi:RNA polymerase primary sigma factor